MTDPILIPGTQYPNRRKRFCLNPHCRASIDHRPRTADLCKECQHRKSKEWWQRHKQTQFHGRRVMVLTLDRMPVGSPSLNFGPGGNDG